MCGSHLRRPPLCLCLCTSFTLSLFTKRDRVTGCRFQSPSFFYHLCRRMRRERKQICISFLSSHVFIVPPSAERPPPETCISSLLGFPASTSSVAKRMPRYASFGTILSLLAWLPAVRRVPPFLFPARPELLISRNIDVRTPLPLPPVRLGELLNNEDLGLIVSPFSFSMFQHPSPRVHTSCRTFCSPFPHQTSSRPCASYLPRAL